MGHCKNCAHWTRDPMEVWELNGRHDDAGISALERGYGACIIAKDGAPMMPKYDSGYTGSLLTLPDFGCTEYEP